jgi:hypothetical protein
VKNEHEVAEVQVERLDDLPVLLGHLQKMHIQEIVDRVITPHGNWQGLSPGWVLTIWLIHILSEHTHCMDRVQPWVAKRLRALQALTGQPVRELDFTDDRLALCLKMLSKTNMAARLSSCVSIIAAPCSGEAVRGPSAWT